MKMKKHNTRQKFKDPVIVSRVKNYLAENVDKPFVDVSQMALCLKERYREYNTRSNSTFCQMVEDAYKVVLKSYGIDGDTTSEDSDPDGHERMYKVPGNKQAVSASGEAIDIISSDEDRGVPVKLPKLGDQITIIPHFRSAQNMGSNKGKNKLHQTSQNEKKRKAETTNTVMKGKKKVSSLKSVKSSFPLRNSKVTFNDIGGISEVLSQVCDLILHMKHPEIYKQLGIKSPRGALLHGPPGTGKTLLAQAIAGKLELPFISVSATELVGGVSGESEERIRELFERASSVAPSVLFIDEVDAICGNRIHAQKDMEKRMVAQLLASLDSLGENEFSVLVLAATNNADALDPALRRAGRLEQEITLGIPSLNARKEILRILCKTMTLGDNIDMHALAEVTPGYVGADLQTLVNKACTFAVKRAFSELNVSEKCDVRNQTVTSEETNENVTNGDKNSEITPITGSSENTESESKVNETVGCASNKLTHENVGILENDVPNGEIAKKDRHDTVQTLKLLEEAKPYSQEQLSHLTIRQEDFLNALKTTKPCAVREGIVTVPDVTWTDIGSLNQVREDLQLAVLAPVKYPEQLKKLGLAIPSGVLLCGPPGCGKTLLAKAVANEAGVNFISVKGPELLNMYVGESERAVRMCFRRARNSAPCVIFFDEFDALCPRRSQQDHNGAARVVNQLLTEMDGIESREGVFVLAASNRPDIIDPAVLRPGRLDRVIYVGMPAKEDRVDILQKLTKGGTQPPLAEDVDLEVISDLTPGFTGADLCGLVRAAATKALTSHIETGAVNGDMSVNFEHFRDSLANCKPSVSSKEQVHYEKLRLKYTSGVDEKDMFMDTEGNGESMDTE